MQMHQLRGTIYVYFVRSCVYIFLLTRRVTKTMPRKFYGLCAKSFGDSTKDLYFLRSTMTAEPWSRIQEKDIVFNFSNNVTKTCSCGLKISRKIEIKYLFILKHIFMYSCKLPERL